MAELQGRMSSREFAEWQAYFELEPFGEERADHRAGIVAATVANVHRGRRQRPYTPEQFMPRYGGRREAQDWQQQLRFVERLNAALGGEDRRPRE